MGYKLKVCFSDGIVEEVDEIFETEEAAIEEYNVWLDSWETGKEVLKMANEKYIDATIEGYNIEEL